VYIRSKSLPEGVGTSPQQEVTNAVARTSYFRIFTLLVAVAGTVVVTLMMAVLPARAASNDDYTAAQNDGGQTDAPIHAQIVGGTDVPNGKYPFMAAIFERVGEGPPWTYGHTCGATLIDPDSVLTAAHCVDDGEFASDLRVTVGRTVLSSNQGYVRNVNRIYIHPYYDSETQKNDVAVLKLSSRVNLPWILLPRSTDNHWERNGRNLSVAGWGETFTEEGYPDRMKETRVPVLSDYWAERFYGDVFYPKVMVAAGREGKDTCFGDSGGPLFERAILFDSRGRRHTVHYQVGITSFSFGESCGQAGYVGAYTEVNNPVLRSFIFDKAAK
jgi:secreted trypsin-like serine protease